MRINKDLVDAVMMLSFISLVLIGTTDFEIESQKNLVMGILGGITVLMIILRVIRGRLHQEETQDREL
ncbi:MAG: hypothetical protein LBU37_08460 [Tannerellaceae bacterium]|jgi:membrane protein CcdC involved in cytochrome C biogenesis|nr:hypothetical protein [Tannerellaceae bacterium]